MVKQTSALSPPSGCSQGPVHNAGACGESGSARWECRVKWETLQEGKAEGIRVSWFVVDTRFGLFVHGSTHLINDYVSGIRFVPGAMRDAQSCRLGSHSLSLLLAPMRQKPPLITQQHKHPERDAPRAWRAPRGACLEVREASC